ncbi:hypothetical protein TNCV_3151051 [Trichonephila clavipes]|nr:hypothetical protein TNCV_3151051 [Trichonephila clavipes]
MQCGKTQNANDSIHSVIWKNCPKETFVSKKRLEMGVISAIGGYILAASYSLAIEHNELSSASETFRINTVLSIFEVTLSLFVKTRCPKLSQICPNGDKPDDLEGQGMVITVQRQSCAVSLYSKGRIEAFTTGSPHMNTIVITVEIESELVSKDDLVQFRCSPVSSCLTPLQTEASMGGCQWQYT